MFHLTVGYYLNGECRRNGVRDDNLAAHVAYNLEARPGRAFFVDGVCVNRGYLGEERCMALEQELHGQVATCDTAPYV